MRPRNVGTLHILAAGRTLALFVALGGLGCGGDDPMGPGGSDGNHTKPPPGFVNSVSDAGAPALRTLDMDLVATDNSGKTDDSGKNCKTEDAAMRAGNDRTLHDLAGRTGRTLTLFVALGALGCGGDDPAGPGGGNGGDTKPPSGLLILVPDAGAPALTTLDTTFIATKGIRSEIRIRYEPVPPDDSGERFLELRIEAESLLRFPGGALIEDGNTVVIGIKIDPTTLSVTLSPSGLQFDPLVPAELELRYVNADPDFDGDGDDDPDLIDDIDLWRQENPGDPWERVGTLKDVSEQRVRANLTEFSRYALGI